VDIVDIVHIERDEAMTKIEATVSGTTHADTHAEETHADGTIIAPLLEEVHAAEAAWREGELPRLSVTDRIALRAARGVLLRSRHQREQATAASEDHTFAHRVEAGMPR
jgi:hypothetical protein